MKEKVTALVSMNAFKGTLSNLEACEVVRYALEKHHIECKMLPLGDGGAGTMRTVQASLGGEIVPMKVAGPLGKPVEAKVLCMPDAKAPESVYLESAEVCGAQLIPDGQRDAMRASSLGLGELLKQSAEKWQGSLKKIYVGLGDSATSDMGMGMLSGVGFQFGDDGGKTLWGNADGLRNIRSVKPPAKDLFAKIKITVLCDVMNPLCGRNGAARIFSPQKGATAGQVNLIEQGMENLAKHLQQLTGRELRTEPMTGAAGGLGAAFLGFLNAELVHGARFLMDLVHFDRLLEEHQILITGEGSTDSQTLEGKAPLECLERARRMGKRSIVISGKLGEGHESLGKKFPSTPLYECGSKPSARDALFDKTVEVFSDPDILESSNA